MGNTPSSAVTTRSKTNTGRFSLRTSDTSRNTAARQPNGTRPKAPEMAATQEILGPVEPRVWLMGTEAFERRMPHHEGIKALWETKWKFPCSKSVYPFHDGLLEDFEPIFEHLIKNNINDGTSPEYTNAFIPTADALSAKGDEAHSAGDTKTAIALYLRAACVLRIARFPYITSFPDVNCSAKWAAWESQKKIYLRAGSLFERPVEEVSIPHVFASGRDRNSVPVYVRTPPAREGEKCPVVLLITGLDGYRPDNTTRCDEFLARGWASVVAECPGTADCPSDAADPAAPDRLWDSVLAWMAADGRFDMGRVAVWGLSAGGYYAVRIAHTHRERVAGVVAQGAGCHHFFGREWLSRVDGHEYPFQLTPAMAMKHGYDSVEDYKVGVQKKFSLLETGIIKGPSTRLLLINGTLDGLMPIEDSMMLLEHGTPKEAGFFPGALHMGYPMANSSVYPWMESVLGVSGGHKENVA
ncbi:probable yellowish-green 1 protein [Cephalotrichum gorgonifer]|uniref:Probable yellowish-green 1 protein n=1 Tax=Cephalotrichum gorgonifer TaxID=2041049 RepID=A0AAE8N2V0_9PEZI|nr:probable yellowish-green 1 protein [Cephalotrichum gorgonifer]